MRVRIQAGRHIHILEVNLPIALVVTGVKITPSTYCKEGLSWRFSVSLGILDY